MRSRIPHLVIAAAICTLVSGCSSADPDAARELGTVEGERPATPARVQTDQAEPTKGLPCRSQSGRLRLCGAATDNYKASFNEDAGKPELRTWLAVTAVELNGQRYVVAPGQELFQDSVQLTAERSASQPQEVRLQVRTVSGPAQLVRFRIGPQKGLWGPLVQLSSRSAFNREPVVVEITVTDPPGVTAAARATYRHDAELARAEPGSLEHNGPGGRWYLGGAPTGTNLELGWE